MALELGGGSAAVELTGSTFSEGSTVYVNHHCGLRFEQTGGLCASHFVIETADGGKRCRSSERPDH